MAKFGMIFSIKNFLISFIVNENSADNRNSLGYVI